MTLDYLAKLGFKVQLTNIGAQKIDGSAFKIFRMVLASFWVNDKLGRSRFFQKTFLLTNISMEVVLGIFFLNFNNEDVLSEEQNVTWSSYIPVKDLLMTKQVQIIGHNEFVAIALDLGKEVFVVHMAHLRIKILIHPT